MNICHFCNKEEKQWFLYRLFSKGVPQSPCLSLPFSAQGMVFYGHYKDRPADPGKNDEAPWVIDSSQPSQHSYLHLL